ncbi:MAG: S41 family peptidase [Caulobacteraceae bacterium]
MARIILALALLCASAPAWAGDNPWEMLADRDLGAAHQLILENHPGPVDPQNPGYRAKLDESLARSKAAAKSARTFSDYKRVMLGYTNAFRDGHLNVFMLADAINYEWPGFLPSVDETGAVTVGYSEVPDVSAGDRILSCDGQELLSVFEKWVAPYYWNRDLPQERGLQMPRTLLIDEHDEARRLKFCDIETAAGRKQVALEWRPVSRSRAPELRLKGSGAYVPPLGLRQIDGVWFLQLPNFWYPDSQAVDRFKAVIADVEAHKDELRNAPSFVIDLRGNTGGISAWGEAMAAALWGKAFIDPITNSFDASVDWRASPSNLRHIDELIARTERDGITGATAELKGVREAMVKALASHEPFARQDSPGQPLRLPTASPVKARVYILTDSICASACLDFMDVLLKLPGVTHIGRPTSADAIYIDVDDVRLPSGLTRVSYSMKVFRKRVRANNQWYDPAIRWPGGPMTDEAVAKWVRTLPPA